VIRCLGQALGRGTGAVQGVGDGAGGVPARGVVSGRAGAGGNSARGAEWTVCGYSAVAIPCTFSAAEVDGAPETY
jgi:hypothetical protein